MKVQLPLRGPLRWLFILVFVWAWPAALVFAFSPESDTGKEAFHLLSMYFVFPVLALMALVVLNTIERGWRSWQHWKRVPHQPGTPFLLGEDVTTLFKGEHVAPMLLAVILNAMFCIGVAYVIQAIFKVVP